MVSRVDRRSAQRVSRLLRQVEPEARQEVTEAIRDGAQRMHGSMLADVPRRTGELAAGLEIRTAKNGLQARVGIFGRRNRQRLFYWKFVEYGTAHHPPQPFFRPAITEQGPIVIRNIERGVNESLLRVARRGG